jgi:predicted ester cyclase
MSLGNGRTHEQSLALFDRLDFEAWSNRDSDLFRQLYGGSVGPRAPPGVRGRACITHRRNEAGEDMGLEQYNMMLFQTADDAWNAQDVETFENRHTEDVVVYVPAAPPQVGMDAHREFAVNSFRTFPDQRVQNRPYKAFFAGGDWVCSIARFTGTMTGPMIGPDGKEIAPTGKSFDVDFCTVGHWKNGQMTEEYLFYDVVTFMKQIGLSE